MSFSIRIVAFGRAGGRLGDEVKHYAELVRPYASLSIEYLKTPAIRTHTGAGAAAREEQLMCARWPDRRYAVAMSQEGRRMDSLSFARWLGQKQLLGKELVFNIGSAHGLPPSLKRRCDEVVSLSPLTLSHSISLVVLVEQLYRAFTILKGHPYHKT